MHLLVRLAAGVAALCMSLAANALEYPIGAMQQTSGMEVAAVHPQAIEMEREGHLRRAAEADHVGRHTDRLTGLRAWFKPFEMEWEFTFAGVGRKGGC